MKCAPDVVDVILSRGTQKSSLFTPPHKHHTPLFPNLSLVPHATRLSADIRICRIRTGPWPEQPADAMAAAAAVEREVAQRVKYARGVLRLEFSEVRDDLSSISRPFRRGSAPLALDTLKSRRQCEKQGFRCRFRFDAFSGAVSHRFFAGTLTPLYPRVPMLPARTHYPYPHSRSRKERVYPSTASAALCGACPARSRWWRTTRGLRLCSRTGACWCGCVVLCCAGL